MKLKKLLWIHDSSIKIIFLKYFLRGTAYVYQNY